MVEPINKEFPCGVSIPFNNPHAVSVSLPTLNDVIRYEEFDENIRQTMQSGYPRFFTNRLVQKVVAKLADSVANPCTILPIADSKAVDLIENKFGSVELLSLGDVKAVMLTPMDARTQPIKDFIQHTGLIATSRRAEESLIGEQIFTSRFDEERINSEAESVIQSVLAGGYGVNATDVLLANTGMNALYSVYSALQQVKDKEKKVFVRLGWQYLDTMEILTKYGETVDFSDEEQFAQYIKENYKTVNAVFCEIPNNPLLQIVNLPEISHLLKGYGIPLIIDSSMATPFTFRLMEYADVVVESLTKFACGNADVIMGAIVLNYKSPMYSQLLEVCSKTCVKPFVADMQRLAHEITDYKTRVVSLSKITKELRERLRVSKKVKQLFCVDEKSSVFKSFASEDNNSIVPPILSVVFNEPLDKYYNSLQCAKGPSFGTEFTLSMAYVYMAHYDLIQSIEGEKTLGRYGLDKNLMRVSVGYDALEVFKNF